MTAVTQNAIAVEEIKAQLEAIGYGDNDLVCYRAFYPERGNHPGVKVDARLPFIPSKKLQQLQEDGLGLYLVVNPGGHKDAEISECRVVFYEHDHLGKDVSRELWRSLKLPEPTLQVDTGGKSVHSYWALENSITPDEWRKIQVRLLEYSDGDRVLKNPSRVMRLAGCKHSKTGEYSRIVGGSGQRYPLYRITKVLPDLPEPKGRDWKGFSESFKLPVDEAIPLEICLTRKSRELVNSGAQSERNSNGFALACDLIAISEWLGVQGQRFSGDPYGLFMEYCQACKPGDGWNQGEWDAAWSSAQKKARGTALSPDFIENCIKSWVWKNSEEAPKPSISDALKSFPEGKAVELEPIPVDADEADKLRVDVRNYLNVLDTGDLFQLIPFRNKLCREYGISRTELDQLARSVEGTETELTQVIETMGQLFAEVEQRSTGVMLPGVPSGFYDLDAMTQGLQRSDLIIVAGRPGMGKTGWSLNVARNIGITQKLPVGIFSLEMSKLQLAYRLISSETAIETSRLRTGRLQSNEWEILTHAVNQFGEAPIFVDDTPNISVAQIRSKLRSLMKDQGALGAVIIDYLQLMEGGSDNRVQELSKITRSLKGLARELNVPIISLSQLSRGVESRTNKRPMMSDLRESGSLEQDADVVMMLYRDEYYDPDTPDRGLAEVIITKHRNGPTGTVKLLFEPQYTRFRNLAQPSY